MRVLQIHNYYATRGGECGVVDDEERLLASRGHEVCRYTVNSGQLTSMPIVGKIYAYWHIPRNPRVARDLARFIARAKPDIAHVHNVFPLLSTVVYDVLATARVPLVQTVHNFRFLCPSGTFFRNGSICERCLEKGYLQAVRHRCMRGSVATSFQYARAIRYLRRSGLLERETTRLIALNKFSADKLMAAGVSPQRLEICGNFAPRIAGDVVSKDDYFLYMGRLSPEKGIWTLLQAVNRASGTRLKIAGSGPLAEEVRRWAANRPNIELLGYVNGERKERLIRKARALVVPSEWYENFPVSVVESMSLGTPVIASRIGGLPEMVEPEVSGLLFEPGDVLDLAECITALNGATDRVMAMGREALRYARRLYGAERHGAELERIYGSLVARSADKPMKMS